MNATVEHPSADEKLTKDVEKMVSNEAMRAERDFDDFIVRRRRAIEAEYRACQRRRLFQWASIPTLIRRIASWFHIAKATRPNH